MNLIRVTWVAADKKTVVAYSFFPNANFAQECVSSFRDCLLSTELEPDDLPLPANAVAMPGQNEASFMADHVVCPDQGYVARLMRETFGIAVVTHPLWDNSGALPIEAWFEAEQVAVQRQEDISFRPIDSDVVRSPTHPGLADNSAPTPSRRPGALLRHKLH